MTSNVYGRLSGANAIGNTTSTATYGGVYGHTNHGGHHGPSTHGGHGQGQADPNYMNNMQPEDYLGKSTIINASTMNSTKFISHTDI